MQGLQLSEINILFFSILALTESVNRTLMKETRARTHVSVLFGHEGCFPVCIWSRINRSNSLPGQKQNSKWLAQEPGSGLFARKCRVISVGKKALQ